MVKLKVISFNIFVGSPLENYFRNGTKYIFWGNRIYNQLDEIELLEPDILCLQEVYSEDILKTYMDRLEKIGYKSYYEKENWTVGRFIYYLLCFVICLTFFSFIFFGWSFLLREKNQMLEDYKDKDDLSNSFVVNVLLVISYFIISLMLVNLFFDEKVIKSFLLGKIKTANVILYKDHLELLQKQSFVKYFKNQSGDFLNLFRKRGFIRAYFKTRSTSSVNLSSISKSSKNSKEESLSFDSTFIVVYNCHLSNSQKFIESNPDLCSNENRFQQIEQMLQTIQRDGIEKFLICGDFNCHSDSSDLREINQLCINSLDVNLKLNPLYRERTSSESHIENDGDDDKNQLHLEGEQQEQEQQREREVEIEINKVTNNNNDSQTQKLKQKHTKQKGEIKKVKEKVKEKEREENKKGIKSYHTKLLREQYTWSFENKLTHGFFDVPDHQSDYIFIKNLIILKSNIVLKHSTFSSTSKSSSSSPSSSSSSSNNNNNIKPLSDHYAVQLVCEI